ncbi:MAG: hypothetical protein D6799_02670 [Bacteroidetes bacterium]|jgi:hypothetical protein|nr:MAG: hypothetical protein D6799_02670 [Bacteroidota bacterium]
MGKNRLKPQKNYEPGNEKQSNKPTDKTLPSKGIIIKYLSFIFGGQYLENQQIFKQIPYFIFLIIIGIIYITNTNIADKKVRDINKLNKEIKELRSEYIITKSELMFLNKQSEIAKRLEPLGIKEITQQPYLIIAEDTTLKIY